MSIARWPRPFVVAIAFVLLVAACRSSTTPTAASSTEAEPSATPATEPTSAASDDATQPVLDTTGGSPAEVAAVEAAVAAFVEAPSSSNGGLLVDAIAASGNARWVPWLLDLLRLQVSSNLSTRIGEVLEDITAIETVDRIPDLIAYGSWSSTNGLDGGEGYRPFKVALYERIDPRFGPLLDSVVDDAALAAIQWGGVPVGGIPELNDPSKVSGPDADWMTEDEIVLGVVVNGEAVAYPLRILARHELANDVVGGEPIAVVYCTLCRSALVFDRRVEGQVVRFLTSGLLANSNKIMMDVETETLWSHLRGIGIGGELRDVELELLPVEHHRWSSWLELHPDTSVLTLPEPIFFDDPERPPIAYDYTPGAAYASYYDNPDVWFPVLDTPDVWPLKTEVLGIDHAGDAVALSIEELNETGEVVEVEVGGMTFTIEPTGVGARVFNAAGERIIAEQSFWFAWYANHQHTRTR